jgi:hypothetical protein
MPEQEPSGPEWFSGLGARTPLAGNDSAWGLPACRSFRPADDIGE